MLRCPYIETDILTVVILTAVPLFVNFFSEPEICPRHNPFKTKELKAHAENPQFNLEFPAKGSYNVPDE